MRFLEMLRYSYPNSGSISYAKSFHRTAEQNHNSRKMSLRSGMKHAPWQGSHDHPNKQKKKIKIKQKIVT